MENLPGYDEWKTTEPSSISDEFECDLCEDTVVGCPECDPDD